MEETIYNLIPQPEVIPDRPPMYRSIHSNGEVKKRAQASFGPGQTLATSPKDFLRRTGRDLPEVRQFRYDDSEVGGRKPPVPTRVEEPIHGLTTQKNFITTNAVDTIFAVPRKPPERDFRYTNRPGYGEVPRYITKIKSEIARERSFFDDLQQTQTAQEEEKMKVLSEEERQEIISGLRARWAQLNKEYQTISFTLDTPAKRQRKERYEAQMAQVERDIEKIAGRPFVFVEQPQGAQQQ
ncbi:putative flagellar associated protein [Paratrimastix pyriformis]|uniref:Flagellar associated protein n=1 Tax=Paratrimastix pyriformis TaxID=342808 RepID=A0ABQ8U541_9EUKA|nr:putative flagellar associated protein [Paratrimastix pyriformis]|eukprot:GAFH01003693.1.p2 GENE.GAFH01003693.1~~GAFH01003693.1.p2  ORF type:complete len:247 (+),score=29.02 GAFH01003693.1:25-741(+)